MLRRPASIPPHRYEEGSAWVAWAALGVIGLAWLGILTVIVLFVVFGTRAVGEQAELMRDSVEVPVTIRSSEVRHLHGSRSGTGPGTSTVTVPAIEFEVAGDDGPIVLDRVFPTPASGNTAWAAAIVARYEPGQQTTGWAPPGRLDETFLVRDWALDPYFAIVFAGGCLAILMAITSLATFFLPPVSRATAGVGIVAPLAIAAWTAWHLWSNVEPDARPDDAWQVGVTVGILIAAILPLLARRQAARWMTRLLRSREADATGAGAFDATR